MKSSAAKSNRKQSLTFEGDEISRADLREGRRFLRFKASVLLHIERRSYATYRTLNEAFPGCHYEINLALGELASSGFIKIDEGNCLVTKIYAGKAIKVAEV